MTVQSYRFCQLINSIQPPSSHLRYTHLLTARTIDRAWMEHAVIEGIMELVWRIENRESIFLSPSDLQETFGIEARQVGSAEIGFP